LPHSFDAASRQNQIGSVAKPKGRGRALGERPEAATCAVQAANLAALKLPFQTLWNVRALPRSDAGPRGLVLPVVSPSLVTPKALLLKYAVPSYLKVATGQGVPLPGSSARYSCEFSSTGAGNDGPTSSAMRHGLAV
jgi:hypothetical protein